VTHRGVLLAALAAAFLLLPALRLPSAAQPTPGRLIFAPIGAMVGVAVTARGTNLAPATRFALVWHSARAHWNVGDGKFNGILGPDATRTLASGTSDAQGTLALHFSVPEDFGYIHDVELQPDGGTVAAHQGFTIIPHLTVAPASGPLGTPITITMTGDGYRFYQLNWHLMYDGAQTGWLSAITTHGTARVTIPATGAIGMHTLQALEGPTAPYLNEQQSPNYQPLIPTVIAGSFKIVPGAPHLPGSVKMQTLPRLHSPGAATANTALPSFGADFRSGVVGSTIALSGHGFTPHTAIAIAWETVVGDDISGNGFALQQRPLTSAKSDGAGAFSVRVRTPDDLGGDHRIIAQERVQPATTTAAITYTITPSVREIAPAGVLRPGEEITIHVKGASWTETGNIYTVDVDDAYFGYACGFFSQGDVTMRIRAPGGSGWHFIDLYPAIYNGKILGPGLPPQGSDVNGSYFLLPMLNVIDHPAERMPAFHFAIRVR
jgi:hypothetical protein